MFKYDKPAYKKEKYLELRKLNRECFRKDPDGYCGSQEDWSHNFEISIDGQVYVMDCWLKGLNYIKRKYGVNLPRYTTFNTLYSLGNKIPDNVDYVIGTAETDILTVTYYLSHRVKFETYQREDSFKIQKYYGENDEIKEIILHGFHS